jgi:hypothetical protein
VTTRVAVLDDYQDAARRFGDWHRLAGAPPNSACER